MPAAGYRRYRSPDDLPFTPEPNTGCWLWTGALTLHGYGKAWMDGRTVPASQLAAKLAGKRARGKCVLHRCDQRSCVNPAHLYAGTNKDNTRDMDARGRRRTPRGSARSDARLNETQVAEILASTDLQRIVAARYGVTQTMVSRIKLRKAWKHVKPNRKAG